MEKKISFSSTGFVLGKYWGGGKGSYAATKIKNKDSRESLIEEAKEMLKKGSLDSGMGYESLIGAILNIETKTIVEIDGKEFVNTEYEILTIGEMTDDEEEFLAGVNFNS